MTLMRLIGLSLILNILGVFTVLLVGYEGLESMRSSGANLRSLLILEEQIDGFSAASNEQLVSGANSDRWEAYIQNAEAIQTKLRELGAQHPLALQAEHRIDVIIERLQERLSLNQVEKPPKSPSLQTATVGPLELDPQSYSAISEVANHSIVLAELLNELIVEREAVIESAVDSTVLVLIAAVLLFGILTVINFMLLHYRIVAPMRELIATMTGHSGGNSLQRARVYRQDELGDLADTLNCMLDERAKYEVILREQKDSLARREHILSEAQRIAQLGRWQLDWQTGAAQWSDETFRIMGVSPDDFTPSRESFLELVHPADRGRLMAWYDSVSLGRQLQDIVFRIVRPNGELRYVQSRVEVAFDIHSKALEFTGTIQDITDLKSAQSALHEQSQLMRTAGRIASLGGWSLDLSTDEIEWSGMVHVIHGVPQGYRPTLDRAIIFYAPQYRDRILTLIANCRDRGKPYDIVCEFINARSEQLWVRTTGEPVYDDSGNIVKIQGLFQDVSVRYSKELQLQEQAKELSESSELLTQMLALRQALINSLPASIALLDATGTIVDVNEQWIEFSERWFGFDTASRFGDDKSGVGLNYIDRCERSVGEVSKEARQVASGLRDVLTSRIQSFSLEYPVHSADSRRWYQIMANRLSSENDEVADLSMVVMHIDITERKLAELELNRIACEDNVTGLSTRLGLLQKIDQYIAVNGWQPDAMLLLLNLVGFRDINDAHGYLAGDHLLALVGQRMLLLTEAIDPNAQPGAGLEPYIARTGGNEYAVFVPEVPGASPAKIRAEIDKLFTTPFDLGSGNLVNIKGIFGYTLFGTRKRDLEELLREGDVAQSQCRREGAGNHWCAYTETMGSEASHRAAITKELYSALENQEFELHFQPKVDLATGEMVSCEALIRWQNPERGSQPPDFFIPIAEKSQLIRPIGEWVINKSCSYMREWLDAGLDTVHISVNVSMIQFSDDEFIEKVARTLQQYDIPPKHLTLEITENVFQSHSINLKGKLRSLQEIGVRTSLDDFGTGYSSLRYLQEFAFNEIKIDQRFVRRMLDEKLSLRIVGTIINIANALEADVVAEGIENSQVAETLQKMGCSSGQGYYYSAPLSANDFRMFLASRQRSPKAED